jgi:DNA-directed RNA polymerase subunit RPC12/RpoP
VYYRKCPECGDEIPYKRIYERDRAEKQNTNCPSCAHKGIIFSDERNKKMSKSKSGKNNSMYGIFGENNPNFGSKRSEETRKKMSESRKGTFRSEETRERMRISGRKRRLREIKEKCGQIMPNHNPVACEIIRWFNMYYDFNFQHAENGGEICIGGYFPDGIDEKRKTIIEIDEPRHFNPDGTYKQKDIQRQKYLENLGYKIIRIKI